MVKSPDFLRPELREAVGESCAPSSQEKKSKWLGVSGWSGMKSRSLDHAEKENRSLFLEGLGLDNAGLVVVVLAHPQRRLAVQKSL